MKNILEIAAIMILCGGCFAMGMYFTTQVGDWINRRIKKK